MTPTTAPKRSLPRRERAGARSNRWSDETIDAMEGMGFMLGAVHPGNREVYDPGERKMLPETGAWIMVIRGLPAIEGGVDEHVRPGRFFFAERDPSGDSEGFGSDGTYKIVVHSPWGDVNLFPHEYARVETEFVLGCWQSGEVEFHPLHIEAARLNEVTFYARSRGVSLAMAAAMALGSLSANIGWFEPVGDLAKEAEEMATDSARYGRLTAVNHKRRSEAQKREATKKRTRKSKEG